jgi:hypothetical protein
VAYCVRCGKHKPSSAFRKDKTRKSGMHPYCRACNVADQRKREHAKTKVRQQNGRACEDCGKPCEPARDGTSKGRYCPTCRSSHQEEQRKKQIVRSAERNRRKRAEVGLRNSLRKAERKCNWILRLGGKCVGCGMSVSENWPAACFDFHHKNGKDKVINLATTLRSPKQSEKLIEKELQKCEVLCSNCHRKLHFQATIEKRRKEIENAIRN